MPKDQLYLWFNEEAPILSPVQGPPMLYAEALFPCAIIGPIRIRAIGINRCIITTNFSHNICIAAMIPIPGSIYAACQGMFFTASGFIIR